LASRVEWTVEDIKDEKKALKKLCECLINLYKNEKEIKRVEELKMDAEILEMYLSFCMDLLEETAQRLLSLHEAHKKFVELVAKVTCTDCKKNLMVNTVLSNWTLRETSQKVGDEKLVERVVERYAKKRGLDEEMKKKYLSALVARDEFEKFSRRLANVADMLERAPRSVQDVVADTASLLNSALTDNDFARNLERYIAELKAIDYFFREGKNEDEAVKELKVTLESIKAKLDEIEAEKKSEMEALMKKIDELRSRIDALESKVSSVLQPQNNKPENIISEAKKIVDTAKQILQEMGYKVEPASVPLHELNKILEQKKKEIIDSLSPEELKNLLESEGYKVVGGPVKWEDVEKMIEDAKKKAYEEALKDKKIEMAADVLRDVTSRFIDLFKPAVQFWIESQTKKEEVIQNLSESLCKNEVEEV
jgi:DNA repair exonuclease SbcCD ATPase subunit